MQTNTIRIQAGVVISPDSRFQIPDVPPVLGWLGNLASLISLFLTILPRRARRNLWHKMKLSISWILAAIIAILSLPVCFIALLFGQWFPEVNRKYTLLGDWLGFMAAPFYYVLVHPIWHFYFRLPLMPFPLLRLVKMLPDFDMTAWIMRRITARCGALPRNRGPELALVLAEAYSSTLFTLHQIAKAQEQTQAADCRKLYLPITIIPVYTRHGLRWTGFLPTPHTRITTHGIERAFDMATAKRISDEEGNQ